MPEIISTNKDDGMKSVNYVGLIGYLVEAIKEIKIKLTEKEI